MAKSKGIPTPMSGGCKCLSLEVTTSPTLSFIGPLVGALQYTPVTRPEIGFSVNKVCQFMISWHSLWMSIGKLSSAYFVILKTQLIQAISIQPWGPASFFHVNN